MGKQPIGFRGNKALINLINIMSAKMGMKKSDFIQLGVETITRIHDETLYNEYKTGSIKILGVDDE